MTKQNNKTEKVEKNIILRRRTTYKSYMAQVASSRTRMHLLLFIPAMILAFFLDILNTIKSLILWIVAIGLVIAFMFAVFVYCKLRPIYDEYDKQATEMVDNSDISTFRPLESTYIYDVHGYTIAKLRGDQDAQYLEYKDIPSDVVDAFVAVEDRTFWDNSGINSKGMIRAFRDAVMSTGDQVHGASTITQQLVRNIFLTKEVSIERKVKEILIATKLTKKYSKQQIMEFYVNNIYYANNFYGVEAAAHGYFSKNAEDLTLSQVAYICAIPNSPEYYNPYKHPERAVVRRDKILGDMLETGLITQDDYDKAIKEKIVIKRQEYEFNNYFTTYAVDCATKWLMRQNGFEFKYAFDTSTDYRLYKKDYNDVYEATRHELVSSGYKIFTSLDSDIQKNVQEILNKDLNFNEETNEETNEYSLQGAVTVFDNNTRKVVAIVGGRDSEESSDDEILYTLNRAYQSTRQPGSTIKPLVVYTPALMNGYTPETTVYNIDVAAAKKKGADAQKMTGSAMSLRSALEQSKNGVSWQIFDKLKPQNCLAYLQDMEFESICPDDYNDASALGGLTNGVTTVEMAGAYAAIQNHGEWERPTCIVKIKDRLDNSVYKDDEIKQVYSSYAADTMTDMMTGVLKRGTAAKLGWYNSTKTIAACKTGTTNGSKDGWLCGFTPYYTVAVWVGYDRPKTLNNLWGATYPGKIWKDTMLSLIEDKETITEFTTVDRDDEIRTYNIREDAYDKYLPGREDDEVLSSGYTVGNYREDRIIGEEIQSYLNIIASSGDLAAIQNAYAMGKSKLGGLKSRSYSSELSGKLDSAYNARMIPAVPAQPAVPAVEQPQGVINGQQ